MAECYNSPVDLFMATAEVKLWVPSVPYLLPDKWAGYDTLTVSTPFYITYVGGEKAVDGPANCTGAEVLLTVDTTEVTLSSFKSFISNALGMTKTLTVTIVDGQAAEWSEECHSELIAAFSTCPSCGNSIKRVYADSITPTGSTDLPDGTFTVYIPKYPSLDDPRYSHLVSLLIGKHKQYAEGNVTSKGLSHGIKSMNMTRQLVDYDSLINQEVVRIKRMQGPSVFTPLSGCLCRYRRSLPLGGRYA